MRKFEAVELKRFLKAVDRRLSEPITLIVIGGSAALLAYDVQRVTQDIDTWGVECHQISSALEAARTETGLKIPVGAPGVQDGPRGFEDRLQAVEIPGLKNLTIMVPEKHDLVLMKSVRGEEPDLQTAEEINRRHGLDLEVLTNRFAREMGEVIGHPRRLNMNFLALVERLYGEEGVAVAKRRLEALRGANRV